MQVIGFYVTKSKNDKKSKVKEIQVDVDKVLMTASVSLVLFNGMTTVAYAGSIAESVQPIIQIFKDLAEPVAYAFMIKGFMKIMSGDENDGLKTIKYAIGGYVGIQWIPMIFNLIKGIKF